MLRVIYRVESEKGLGVFEENRARFLWDNKLSGAIFYEVRIEAFQNACKTESRSQQIYRLVWSDWARYEQIQTGARTT